MLSGGVQVSKLNAVVGTGLSWGEFEQRFEGSERVNEAGAELGVLEAESKGHNRAHWSGE